MLIFFSWGVSTDIWLGENTSSCGRKSSKSSAQILRKRFLTTPKKNLYLCYFKTCSVQSWRCSSPELQKGCVFLKCHVGELSVCTCICHPWSWSWSSSSSSSSPQSSSSPSSSSSLMNISWCYYQIQHICHRGWRICWSLMKIWWCYVQIRHMFQRWWWVVWALMKISWCEFPI